MNISKKIFIVVISIIILIVAIHIAQWLIFSNGNMWKYSAEFENFNSDFCVVKDYVEEQFPSQNGKWVSVSITDGYVRTLFDPDVNDYINIPDNVRSSLETICDYGFPNKDSVLDVIRIYDNRISFCIENGRYALVYSPDEKPTWLNFPDEQEDVKVKKINDDWYHVVLISK